MTDRRNVPWLELFLISAVLALILQVFPSLCGELLRSLDARNWSRGVWIAANLSVVISLVGLRFGPELMAERRGRRKRVSENHEYHAKQLTFKEERDLYERMREARKRQVV